MDLCRSFHGYPTRSATKGRYLSRAIAMTDASRSTIIEAKPIAHGLDAFRDSTQSLLQGFDASSFATLLERIAGESKA
jgi:hypothetical protein